MDEIKPRYEFRVWADTLASVNDKLRRMAQPRTAESEETYLISSATDKCNAKIRAALMDIKVLVAEDRGLEQWKPILKETFPLESSVIATPGISYPRASCAHVVEIRVRTGRIPRRCHTPDARLAIANVRKTRYQFRIGTCTAEYAQIIINGVPRDTVAVESVDPDAVLRLVRELGVDEPNTSYIREIKRLLDFGLQQSGS